MITEATILGGSNLARLIKQNQRSDDLLAMEEEAARFSTESAPAHNTIAHALGSLVIKKERFYFAS